MKILIISILILTCSVFSSCSNKQNTTKNISNNVNIEKKQSTEEESEKTEETTVEVNNTSLSNKEVGWGYRPNSENKVPEIPGEIEGLLKKYSSYYVGDTSNKKLYLTFDEGYENGFTGEILDILKANNVPAAFFVTKPYILKEKDLIKRMVDEGHIVANHTSTHPSMPDVAGDSEKFKFEFEDTENAFKEITGKDMPKYFRPPMGKYSEKTLHLTNELGYKSIFWSFAHKDWEVDNQPSVEATKEKIKKGMHNGCIILLHAVSESNTKALDSVLKELKADGYEFLSLDDLK